MRTSKLRLVLLAFLAMFLMVAVSADAATGTFTIKTKEVQEVGGSWRLYVKIELPKAPLVAHQSMRFVFTKTMVYERSLIDGHEEPVLNRTTVQNSTPSTESLDVNFSDATGKAFKITTFDFALTRTREYEAGEYTVELRTAEGTVIGAKQSLVLKGDNPPVDRRSMAFNAKNPGVKKIDNYDGGAQAKNDESTSNNTGNGEVTPTGTATGFVPKEGLQETEEEKIKTKPGGCGCEAVGTRSPASALLTLLPILGIGIAAMRRRRRVA